MKGRPAFGMSVMRGTRAERTSSRFRGRSLNLVTGLIKERVTPGSARFRSVRCQTGADWADVRGAVFQPLIRDLSIQLIGGVYLNVVVKALCCAPVLTLLAMSGLPTSHRAASWSESDSSRGGGEEGGV